MNISSKRFLSLLLALVMLLSLLPAAFAAERSYDGTERLYVDLSGGPDWWTDNEAVQRAYFFGGEGDGWTLLTPLTEGGSVLAGLIPAGSWTHVILVRCDPTATEGSYWDAKWNQTGNIPLEAEKDMILSFAENSESAQWGVYTEPGPGPDQEAELTEITLPNGDFELGDATGWTLGGLSGEVATNQWASNNGSNTLNLWASDSDPAAISVAYTLELSPDTYQFSFDISGAEADSKLSWSVLAGEEVLAAQSGSVSTTGWDQWQTVTTDRFLVQTQGEVTFLLSGTTDAGYWGNLDNLKLFGANVKTPHVPEIYVPRVPGVEGDDFMRGTDVSSFLSILNSGAEFKDFDGNVLDGQGFFDLLAESGFNYVRLRVWNDPFDSEGRGYGGGNCDVNAAVTMGRWATNAGMRVLIDFHYSDFWADPGKQKAPKAWSSMSTDEKVTALGEFTYNSLATLLEAGVDVGMVQVGNETNNSIAGVSSVWNANGARMIGAGVDAIRRISTEYDHPILAAVHQANPNSLDFNSFLNNLESNGVYVDVFGSSYYPYWHGSLSNLTSKLTALAQNHNVQVYVAETSWAWTLADGDGHDNTVRTGNNDNATYDFSVQGQADELVAVTKALTAVGEASIGVFYWENAWIPVQYAYDEAGNLDADILASNKAKWEEFGSGWASSYASEYDPSDAGVWFGGSAVDNQANFDFEGNPLDSLCTWRCMMTGEADTVTIEVTGVENPQLSFAQGDTLALPETVAVSYSVGADEKLPVVWNAEDVARVDMDQPGVYKVRGTVATAYGDFDTVATVTVNYPNLLRNPGFEESDLSMYTISNGSRTGDDPHSGSRSLHFYNSSARTLTLEQTVTLEPGDYSFSLFAQGDAKGSEDIYIYVTVGEDAPITQDFGLAGWAVWQNPEIAFTVTETAAVKVGLHLAFGAGGWGTVDDLYLSRALEDPLEALRAEIAALNPLEYTGASWAAMLSALQAAEYGEAEPEVVRYAIDNLERKSGDMALGSDISAAANGDRSYRDANGTQRKLYDIITNDYGYNMVRLRTWTGNENGSCGKNTIISYAKLCANAGLRIMIDFHYADSWADPGKQPPPAAWNVGSDVSAQEADRVAQLLYDYTYDFISTMVSEGVYPEWVQVGNEINGGMVWPLGSTAYMDNFVKLLQAGTDAVRAASPTTKIVIHRSSAEETENVLAFYQNLIDNGYTDFDVIGLSFYPYDMDPTYLLSCVGETFTGLYESFCADTHREIMLTEIGSNYMEGNGATYNQGYNMIVNCIRKLQAIPDGRGSGCMYWEIENYEYTGSGSRARPTVVWQAFSPGAELINQTPVTGLALSASEITLQVNDAQSLSVSYTPAKPDITELSWSSSNPEVASVNGAGLVLALSVGETDITIRSVATADGQPVTACCHVTVTPEVPGLKNGGFELGDKYWVIGAVNAGSAKISASDNHLNGSYSLHYAADANGLDASFSQQVTGIEPGIYTLSCRIMGDNKLSTINLFANTAAQEFLSGSFQTKDWGSSESYWITATLENIVVGQDGVVTVGAKMVSSSSSAWGDFDDFTLVKTGEPEIHEDLPELTLYESVSAGATISVSFSVRTENLAAYESFYIEVVKHDPVEGDVVTRYGEGQTEPLTLSGSSYKAAFNGITAKQLGVRYSARLWAADSAGQIFCGPEIDNCIRDMLEALLLRSTEKAVRKTLAADMLNYGAAAQVFMDYETEHLVNKELSAEALTMLHRYETKTLPAADKINTSVTPEGESVILYHSISLLNQVQLQLNAKLDASVENVQIKVTGHETGETVAILDTVRGGSSFKGIFDRMSARELRTEYDFVTLVNGVETGNTRTISVEGCVREIRQGSNQKQIALANALLTYGDSVVAALGN